MAGRLVCDLKISARELIKAESYDLGSLLEQDEELRADVSNMFSSATALVQLMERTMADAVGMARIMHDLNIIPLALEMTKVAGNVMSRTLAGGHAERADYLLLHAFTENDYIAPEKHRDRPEGRVTLSGGLVLEPHAGLYRTFVLLLDFASLYPSIVREYTRTGVLSAEMTTLVESRREVKRRMTGELSARLLRQCDARQTALKLTANSIYGCLGHVHSRFYCPELASSITARGRDILLHTQTIIEEMNYRVIYGDTDSVMVDTNSMDYHAAVQIGNDIKDKVNTFYSKVELEIDGIYKSMLLLKKKKYAGIKVSKRNEEFILEREIKGLDIVRRDWSVLARDTANVALEQILSEEPLEHKITEIRALLEGTARDLKANNVPLRSLVIKKRLNKDPESYNVKNTAMPHVTVALRHNQLSGRPLLRGDVVPYLICEDGTARTALHRAYHISELAEAEHIRPDVGYYLTRQLYPVLSRLCEPLQGLDAAEVGRMLEVDAAQTPGRVANPVVQRLDAAIEKLAGGEFARCEPFSFKCHGCKTLIVVTPPKEAPFPLERCPGPGCQSKPYGLVDYIGNWLQSAVRRLSEKYYKATMVCEGALCPNRTACVPLRFRGPDPVCDVCNVGLLHSTFTERDMYTQLKFFRHVFDLSAVDKSK